MFIFQVKRKLSTDPRYDAVGSSSLREELFNTFLKGVSLVSAPAPQPAQPKEETSHTVEDEETMELDEAEQRRQRKERKERAVKEREDRVRAERSRLEADIGRSRMDIHKEEGESMFKCAVYLPLSGSVILRHSLCISFF